MTVKTDIQGEKMVIALEGKLDISTVEDFQKAVEAITPEIKDLTLDLTGLQYTSSVGLRTILTAQNTMEEQGQMRVIGVCDDIMDIFRLTRFDQLITIE